MVEPAIGITAAAIATLRPLFVNFLSLSRKRLDGSGNNTYSTSTSTLTSTYTKDSRPSVSSYGYSDEFAEMLGLSKFGVTTTVTAGRTETKSERRRRERTEREREKRMIDRDTESQTELRDIEGQSESGVGGYGWDVGIKATTVVVIDG